MLQRRLNIFSKVGTPGTKTIQMGEYLTCTTRVLEVLIVIRAFTERLDAHNARRILPVLRSHPCMLVRM